MKTFTFLRKRVSVVHPPKRNATILSPIAPLIVVNRPSMVIQIVDIVQGSLATNATEGLATSFLSMPLPLLLHVEFSLTILADPRYFDVVNAFDVINVVSLRRESSTALLAPITRFTIRLYGMCGYW